ncbi:6500_t:CDS:2 [Racocetra fulgida]|uniref:6500_t:CDS:1 n=1 Tax=Racocetra fulgida TaxID=60492 RepID=A0A9N8ZJD4_9GLOM|nr:6500_t:CDS:2 [Racocetra fulgida]
MISLGGQKKSMSGQEQKLEGSNERSTRNNEVERKHLKVVTLKRVYLLRFA